ncbi:MAG: hypothetical protein IJS82_05180 [Paludibacteraceae bacterium]|nr:hypothetical protein [Paludibacteraceae bacterium]
MEIPTRTVQVTLPSTDAAFLRRLSGNMGWTIKTQRRQRVRKSYYESPEFYRDIQKAEQDIADGKGVRVTTNEALDALFA